jgi:Calcineurin-like phosphoesterase
MPEREKSHTSSHASKLKTRLDFSPSYKGPVSSVRPGKIMAPPGNPVGNIKENLRFIPPPVTNNVNLAMEMDSILPQQSAAAEDAKTLVFHAVGDTGGVYGDDVEKAISGAMNAQISPDENIAANPAFLYILGDVVYFNGENKLYPSQFYEPFQYYRASIFAIAGNHDGDTNVRPGDPPDTEPSLFGFMRNFCDTTSQFESPYRPTMTQPYVYWTFDTPLAKIVGLYSNVDGSLDARGSSEQQNWLEVEFSNFAKEDQKDKALILTVHHPPYSLDTTHRGYADIQVAIDRAIQNTGCSPTIVLTGHLHSYQRFDRNLNGKKIPYVTAGAGGYANRPQLLHKIETVNGQPLKDGLQTTLQGILLMKHNDLNPGFLRITVDGNKKTLTSEYFVVPFVGTPSITPFDSVSVPWG